MTARHESVMSVSRPAAGEDRCSGRRTTPEGAFTAIMGGVGMQGTTWRRLLKTSGAMEQRAEDAIEAKGVA